MTNLRDHELERIRGEFTEMPGLRLTALQARRFFGVDERTCTRVLDALIAERFLSRFGLETYGRGVAREVHAEERASASVTR